MENNTIRKLRKELAFAIKEQERMKKEYGVTRISFPFDKLILDNLRHDLKKKTEYIIQLKAELETYQLEFLFGA